MVKKYELMREIFKINLELFSGKIRRIDNLSGHFCPAVQEGVRFPALLKKQGLDISGAKLELYDISIDSKGYVENISKEVDLYLP